MGDGTRLAASPDKPGSAVSDERWERVKQLLHQAMQLTPEQRVRFLDEACPGDDPCRAEIDSLLVADAEARSSFLKPASSGGLHAEQHYEYHRPMRPGDVLAVEIRFGEVWEKESKRAGKLTFRERIVEYRDQHGELVVTARGVSVTTERPVDQG